MALAIDVPVIQEAQLMRIPCKINRASIGEANYVFAILQNLIGKPSKIAWVPRKDLTILTQGIQGSELDAELTVQVINETASSYSVLINNEGIEEILVVRK